MKIILQIPKFLILSLVFVIILIGVTPISFASVESEAREDIQAGCREGNTLVFRYVYKDYVCVNPDTANRWTELGIAEIYQEFTPAKEVKPIKLKPQFTESPTPPPIKTPSKVSDETGCRDGYSLVFRFVYHDTFCTSPSTAASWERLGLAEILAQPAKPEINMSSSKIIQPNNAPVEKNDEIKNEIVKNEETEKKIEVKSSIPDKLPKKTTSTFVFPEYPDQPTINPKLLASNDFWTPPEIHKINKRIWVAVGYDTANSIMIEGEKGIVIVDTLSSYETAKKVLTEFRKITDKPVKTIIYTQGSPDHVQGTKAFLEEGDGDVEIIGHDSLLDSYLKENGILGEITAVRSTYATGALLPDDGPDQRNLGVFPISEYGTSSFVPPTHPFSSSFSLDISGVKMELTHQFGDKSDKIYVWLPDDKALLAGDYVYGIFPNIHSLIGNPHFDVENYLKVLDKMIMLKPEFLVSSHAKPYSEKGKIELILVGTRDATQYIYDQTIRGINNGYSVDELSRMVTLPEWAENRDWLSESRGQIPWHVKQIYYDTLGWYQGDPAFLLSVSDSERSKKIVDGFGGIDETINKIQEAITNEEYFWATELASYVLTVDSDNDETKLLKAFALRIIGQQMLSADARNWALTSALELEGKIKVDSNSITKTSADVLKEIPIENLLITLSSKIDIEKIDIDEFILNVKYTDTNQEFTLLFRHGIITVNPGLSSNEHATITLDTFTHKKILTGNLELSNAISSGNVKVSGSQEDVNYWLGSIDPLMISTQGIRD